MDGSQFSNVIALALSVLAVAVSTLSALRQSRLMQHANLLPVLIDMFRDFREHEFRQHVVFIEKELWDPCHLKGIGIDDLPAEVRSHVIPVMNFFANAGMLVANKVISGVLAASYMRGSAQVAWSHLAPYIRNERDKRKDETYYLFFEHLAFVIGQYEPSKLKKVLNLKTVPESLEEFSARIK
jgi:hypothetical protein